MEEREREIRSMAAAAFSLSAAAPALICIFISSLISSARSPSLSILFLLSVFWFLPNKSLVRNSNQSKTTSELIEKIMHYGMKSLSIGKFPGQSCGIPADSFAVDSTSIFL